MTEPGVPLAPERDPRRGRIRKAIAVTLAVIGGVPLLAVWEELPAGTRALVGIGAVVAGGALWALYESGARQFVEMGEEVLARDPRPPVVYLRSFDTDDTPSNLEQDMVRVFERAGPLVAVGRPGDTIPSVGAARFYVGDKDWQSFVSGLLDRASLVVMLAGKTDGLVWELGQCNRRLGPERLVVLLPRDRGAYEEFRNSAQQAGIAVRLPEYPEKGLARFRAGDISGLIHFDNRWNGTVEVFPRARLKGASGYEISTASNRAGERLKAALQPVAASTGLDIPPPRVSKFAIALWIYLGLGVLFLLIMVGLLASGVIE